MTFALGGADFESYHTFRHPADRWGIVSPCDAGGAKAVIGIKTLTLMDGGVPSRVRGLRIEWSTWLAVEYDR